MYKVINLQKPFHLYKHLICFLMLIGQLAITGRYVYLRQEAIQTKYQEIVDYNRNIDSSRSVLPMDFMNWQMLSIKSGSIMGGFLVLGLLVAVFKASSLGMAWKWLSITTLLHGAFTMLSVLAFISIGIPDTVVICVLS